METFKTIETQEQFDAAIQDRLKREAEKYAGFDEYKKKAESYDDLKAERDRFETTITELSKDIDGDDKNPGYKKQSEELTGQVKSYKIHEMKAKVARNSGIPIELADRLSGKDEEELKKDAESMSKILKKSRKPQPLASNDNDKIDKKRAAMKDMLTGLKGE